MRKAFLFFPVSVIFSAVYLVLLSALVWYFRASLGYFSMEDNLILESFTYVFYGLAFGVAISHAGDFWQTPKQGTYVLLLLLWLTALLREMGMQHWLTRTDTTAIKIRFSQIPIIRCLKKSLPARWCWRLWPLLSAWCINIPVRLSAAFLKRIRSFGRFVALAAWGRFPKLPIVCPRITVRLSERRLPNRGQPGCILLKREANHCCRCYLRWLLCSITCLKKIKPLVNRVIYQSVGASTTIAPAFHESSFPKQH